MVPGQSGDALERNHIVGVVPPGLVVQVNRVRSVSWFSSQHMTQPYLTVRERSDSQRSVCPVGVVRRFGTHIVFAVCDPMM